MGLKEEEEASMPSPCAEDHLSSSVDDNRVGRYGNIVIARAEILHHNLYRTSLVYFLYDLSPITVTIKEERRSFLHFITRLCAVLAGTFALTGILDRWMYRLVETLTKPSSRSTIR